MKNRNFWLYATGMLVSVIGSGVQGVAIPLFILDLTGSGTIMGTFMVIGMVPAFILYPIAGVIGDRVNRKSIMVSMDFGRGAVILLLALLAAKNMITIPVLLVATFGTSLMSALFGPATGAMLPDLVKEEDLTRANSILGSMGSFSQIVGPALGGVIYALGGIQLAFLINGISFVGSGVSELFIQYYQKTKKLEKVSEVITDLKEGISFVKARRGLLPILVFALIFNFLFSPVYSVVVPYVLRIVIKFSAEQFGMIQASAVVGTLFGNVIIGTVLARAKIEKMLRAGILSQTGIMLVFAVLIFPQVIKMLGYASWTLFSVIFCTFTALGVFVAFVNIPLSVALQKMTPTEYRARVFSVLGVISAGMVPIGVGIMGILLDRVSPHVLVLFVFFLNLPVVFTFIFKYLTEVARELNAKNE